MRTRSLSALAYAAVFVAALARGGWPWTGLVAAIAAIGTLELYHLARMGGRRPSTLVGVALAPAAAMTIAGPPSGGDGVGPGLGAILALGVIAAFAAQLARPAAARAMDDWTVTVAGPVYLGCLLGHLIALRALPGGQGLAWTALTLGLVWGNDSAAYLGGRAFGRRPFFPSLSPRKTLEGGLVGLAASMAIGWAAPALAGTAGGALAPLAGISPVTTAGLGLAVGILGPAGDLAESFLKRQVGAKDSGRWIPGHGGILDRVDSIAFAAPMVYYVALWMTR